MMTKTKSDALRDRIARLESERDALNAALAALEAERGDFSDRLMALQAAAERDGGQDALQAAENAERQDRDLSIAIQRKRAALRAVDGDLDAARADLAAALRAEQLERLADLRGLSGKLCDRLEKDLADRAGWSLLQAYHDEARELVAALYGQDAFIPGHDHSGALWAAPLAGLRAWLNACTLRGPGWSLATVAGAPPALSDAPDLDRLPKTLRQSMGL